MEGETEEGQLRRAYQIGLKLKNSGLDEDIIYARIENQGIDPKIAMQVAKDISIERHRDSVEDEKPQYQTAIAKIVIGIIMAIIIFFIFPGQIFIPLGLIISGVIYALLSYNKTR